MTPYQQELIRLANDEWLAYYQYWAGAAQVKNAKLKAELLEHADEERKHADWLTDILADHGLEPEKQFSGIIGNTNCGYDMPVVISDSSILESNLKAERCAIEAYSKILMQTDNVKHHKLLHKIFVEEVKHEQDLLKLQGLAKAMSGLYLLKSQLHLIDPHHIAYRRVNNRGTVSNIAAKGSPRPDHDFSPRGAVGENIDIGSRSHNYDFIVDPDKKWGISRDELKSMVDGIVADVPNYTFSIRCNVYADKMRITIHGKENNGDGMVDVTRVIQNGKYDQFAYHSSFDASKTGGGIARAINRGCMNLYKRLGTPFVKVYANCDVGGYAWAKFGFAPKSEAEYRDLRLAMRTRLSQCYTGPTVQRGPNGGSHFRAFTQEEFDEIDKLLDSDDPKTLWRISDSKGRDGLEIGKALLLNQAWEGRLDIKDPASMDRFAAYVNPKAAKPKATQLSLF